MVEMFNNSFFETFKEKGYTLTGSQLKLLAVFTMVIDHVAAYCLTDIPSCSEVHASVLGWQVSVVSIMRAVGRLAFPLYAFLLVEGYLHTHNRAKYGRNLLSFAFLSEAPWDLINHGTLFCLTSQNIFFTLWLGYLGMYSLDKLKGDAFGKTVCLVVLAVISVVFRSDYHLWGWLFIMGMYALRPRPVLRFAPALLLLPTGWAAFSAFIPAGLYDGSRGFIRGKALKYAFYVFYPVHLSVLYIIKCFI